MKKKQKPWVWNYCILTRELRIMKAIVVLLFVSLIQAYSATGFSQEKQVNLKLKQASILDVISEIEKQSDYKFFFSPQNIDVQKTISIDIQDKNMTIILEEVFGKTNVAYRIIDNQVILTTKNNAQVISQQVVRVSGLVSDVNGDPLPGVNVFEKSNPINGVITGIDGKYTIELSSKDAVLSFSFIGFEGQEVNVASRTNINITLIEEATDIGEVVVVGYGTQRKANLTGSVATVNAEQLTSRPVQSVSAALAGTMAGVNVVQTSGEPGSQNGSITIRGKNSINGGSPLVIIDGIPGSMSAIDINDIENISVLKDAASAAIYGVSAANGVILITTKRGKKDQKTQLSYSSYYSWTKPTYTPNYLGSYDYATLYNEGYKNDNPTSDIVPFSPEDLQKFKDGSSPYTHPDTDWFGEVLNKHAFEQSHHVQVSGGTKSTTYNTSFGFLDQGALIDNIDYNRYNVRANIQTDISEKLSVGMNLYGHQEYKNSNWDSSGALYGYLTRTPPTKPIYNEDGSYSYNSSLKNAKAHIGNDGYRKNNWTEGKIILNAQYRPVKNFTLKGVYSGRYNYSLKEGFKKKLVYSNAITGDTYDSGQREMYENYTRQQRTTYQLIADYNTTFADKHNFKVLGGFEQFDYQNSWTDASRKGFSSDDLNELDNGDGENRFNRGNSEEYGRRSFFGRLNYDYRGKYLFEANMRYDGTSWFSKDMRWGLFPSLSAGWRISEEAFMQDLSWLDNLKLRVGWGATGNNELGSYKKAIDGKEHWFGQYYEYVPTYGVGGAYIFDDKLVQGAWEGKYPNESLTWATVTSYEGAVEASAYNGLIGFELAYYQKKTTDMILNLPVPTILGISGPPQNAGELKNSGFDLLLTHRNKLGDFSYDVNLNFSYVQNEVSDLKGADGVDPNEDLYWLGAGYAFGSFYGYESEGLFNTQKEIDDHATQLGNIAPGDIKYKDQLTVDTNGDGVPDAGDGVINGDDRVVIGKNFPSYILGMNLNTRWRNWDLSLFLQGAFDVDVYFENEAAYAFFNGGKVLERHLDHWSPDNMDATYPRITMSQQHNYAASDYWLRDGSYLRLKNFQIGYSLPAGMLDKVGIGYARIYFSGENLLTFTKVDDFDPEAPAINRGWFYGNVKKLSLGLKVNF